MSSSESESDQDQPMDGVEENETSAPIANIPLSAPTPDKSIYEQVLKKKELEDVAELKECGQLTKQILSLQYARPDLDILNPTELEKELAGKNSLELRKIWISAQTKAGIYNPYALPTLILGGINTFVKPGGKKVPDRAYQDTNLLNCINDLLPDRLKNFNHIAHAIQVLCTTLLVDDVPENYCPYRDPPQQNIPQQNIPQQNGSDATPQQNIPESNGVCPASVPNVDCGESSNGQDN